MVRQYRPLVSFDAGSWVLRSGTPTHFDRAHALPFKNVETMSKQVAKALRVGDWGGDFSVSQSVSH